MLKLVLKSRLAVEPANRWRWSPALPLKPGDPSDDRIVLAFLDRSDPVETFDNQPHEGDNAVLIVPRDEVKLSIVKGVCLGDWRGQKVDFGPAIDEPVDLDVDPTGMDVDASDAWVDLVDDLGCDCSKVGGYPVWANAPVDVGHLMGEMVFHHRLTSDVVNYDLADGAGVFTFTSRPMVAKGRFYGRSQAAAPKQPIAIIRMRGFVALPSTVFVSVVKETFVWRFSSMTGSLMRS